MSYFTSSFLVTSISFKEKCESHVDPSLFYNDRCYLSTTTLHSTNYSNWLQLHEQCKHFPSPKLRHLAFVKDNNHLQLLQNNYVIHVSDHRGIHFLQRGVLLIEGTLLREREMTIYSNIFSSLK